MPGVEREVRVLPEMNVKSWLIDGVERIAGVVECVSLEDMRAPRRDVLPLRPEEIKQPVTNTADVWLLEESSQSYETCGDVSQVQFVLDVAA